MTDRKARADGLGGEVIEWFPKKGKNMSRIAKMQYLFQRGASGDQKIIGLRS